MQNSRHLSLILEKTGGSLFVFIPQLAQLTGWSEKRLRNAPEQFPLKIQKVGFRVGIPAVVLADYLDNLTTHINIDEPSKPRKPGRPRKADQI